MPKYIIDELIGDRRVEYLMLYIGLLVGYNFIGGFLVIFLRGKSMTSKGIVFNKFQTFIAEKLLDCDFEELENAEFLDTKEKAGKFLYANGQGFGVVLDSAVNIIGKLIFFCGLIAVLATLSIWVVCIFVILVVVNAMVESKVNKRFFDFDMEKAPIERKTGYFLGLIENFSFGKEIRIYGIKQWILSKISFHLSLSNSFYEKQVASTNRSQYFNAGTVLIREVVSYGYLAHQIIKGLISIGDFTMYLSAITQFSSSMNDTMKSILHIKQFGFYYEALDQYINVPAKMRAGKKLPIPDGNYEIEFRDVSYKYSGQSAYALRHVNIKITNGEKLSIVGENGAGKTTFAKLLCRMYDPTEGVILLNGQDIREMDYDQYLSIISAVFQDFKLFSFTIKENICFSEVEDSQDDEISKIIVESGLGEKITKLDKGIHTHVYKNFETDGFEPSGGEGQKLALARAIYKNAPIVILDEPTSALDPRAEYEIYQKFNDLVRGKTAIYISHRLSSTRFCDHIAVFQHGEIIEFGSHQDLLEKNGYYTELFNMQAQFYV
jgi:ABC-type multidrug transport system fused ATPase/permease subunit